MDTRCIPLVSSNMVGKHRRYMEVYGLENDRAEWWSHCLVLQKNSLRTGNHGLFCQMISLVLNMVICHSNMLDYERIYGTNLLSLVVWFISILTICFRCALHIGHGTEKRALFNSKIMFQSQRMRFPKCFRLLFFTRYWVSILRWWRETSIWGPSTDTYMHAAHKNR